MASAQAMNSLIFVLYLAIKVYVIMIFYSTIILFPKFDKFLSIALIIFIQFYVKHFFLFYFLVSFILISIINILLLGFLF